MESSIKKIPKSQVDLKIEISSEEFNGFIEKAISALEKDLEVKGFRKGKAPKEIVEKEIGQERILAEAANLAINENYKKAVLEQKLEPISQPEVSILKLARGNPLIFQIKVAILPKIKLTDYKKIASQVEKKKISVSEKETEDALVWVQKSRANFTPLQTPAKEGDFIEIEYQSPQINPSQKMKDAFSLGKGQFLAGFEENLMGMKTGDEKTFSLSAPKDYFKKELAGKNIDFTVKINLVQKMELPEINDDLARSLGKFVNLEGLKENIKERLTMEKKEEENQRAKNEVLEKISQGTNFEIPDILVQHEEENLFRDFKQMVAQNLKISFEEYLTAVRQTEKNLKESFQKEAQKRVRHFLILKEIGKSENISVTDEEINAETNKTIKNYPPDKVKKLDLPRLKDYTKEVIYNQKVLQRLESFSR